jgi:hypothetical protein
MSKHLWLVKLMKLTLSDAEKAKKSQDKNEWGECSTYLKLVIQRINSMIDYMNSKND